MQHIEHMGLIDDLLSLMYIARGSIFIHMHLFSLLTYPLLSKCTCLLV